MENSNIISIIIDKKKHIVKPEEKIAKLLKVITKTLQFKSQFVYLSFDGIILDPQKSLSFYGILSTPKETFDLRQKESDIFTDESKIMVEIIHSGKSILAKEISKYTSIFDLKRLLKFENSLGYQICFNGELLKDWFVINKFLDEEEDERSIVFELILNQDLKINVHVYLDNEICQTFPEVSIGFDLSYFVQTLQKKHQFNIKDISIMTDTHIIDHNRKISDIFQDFTQKLFLFLNDNSKTILLKFRFENQEILLYMDINEKVSDSLPLITEKFKLDSSNVISDLRLKNSLLNSDKKWCDLTLECLSEVSLGIIIDVQTPKSKKLSFLKIQDKINEKEENKENIVIDCKKTDKKEKSSESENCQKEDEMMIVKIVSVNPNKIINIERKPKLKIQHLKKELEETLKINLGNQQLFLIFPKEEICQKPIQVEEMKPLQDFGKKKLEFLVLDSKISYQFKISCLFFLEKEFLLNFDSFFIFDVSELKLRIKKELDFFSNLEEREIVIYYDERKLKKEWLFELDLNFHKRQLEFKMRFRKSLGMKLKIIDYETKTSNIFNLQISKKIKVWELKNFMGKVINLNKEKQILYLEKKDELQILNETQDFSNVIEKSCNVCIYQSYN